MDNEIILSASQSELKEQLYNDGMISLCEVNEKEFRKINIHKI